MFDETVTGMVTDVVVTAGNVVLERPPSIIVEVLVNDGVVVVVCDSVVSLDVSDPVDSIVCAFVPTVFSLVNSSFVTPIPVTVSL